MSRPVRHAFVRAIGTLFVVSTPPVWAQDPSAFAPPATSVASANPWAWTASPALMDSGPRTVFASYGLPPWGIKGLSATAIHLLDRIGALACVVGVDGIVFGPMVDLRLSAGLAGTLSSTSRAGATFRVRVINVAGYNAELVPELDAGLHITPAPHLSIGAAVSNATASHPAGSPPEQRLQLGIALRTTDSIGISLDVVHYLRRPAGATVIVEWSAAQGFTLRGGTSISPIGLLFGASVIAGAVGFDVNAALTAPVGIALRCSVRVAMEEPAEGSEAAEP